ncbi:hypothetical protein [Nocardioides jiangxiensis]|uniref:Uncharacterized protein n=1 Tax=Nocardioides jiangxiensis TaxID=3064524 RepID=A0ABT9B104_9ACTN|nr:hypothetical protein [Nocardioides sp. WY-20]MDO7867302.1 hypothetical protein [Nocardioides sp. WY-20]
MAKKRTKQTHKELRQLRAELKRVRRELAELRSELGAVTGAGTSVVPLEKGPGPVEVETVCAPKSLLPKTECCGSKERCTRCPILMLKQGTLPEGMTVKHRKLVGADGKKVSKKALRRVA